MSMNVRLVVISAILLAANAWGQARQRDPHVGFLYPAGGQQGATFQLIAGGQQLNGVKDVYVSGTGVRASVKYFLRPTRPLEKEQRQELIKRIAARRAVLTGTTPAPPAPQTAQADMMQQSSVELPDHPLIRDLDELSLNELAFLESEALKPRPKQPNPQLAERALIDVTIDPGAALGDREVRLNAAAGLTNPICFQVGTLPEVFEKEPNERKASATPADGPAIALPAILNGQVMPGDSDRFRFAAHKGERLVIAAQARSLIPYLADAVPGWFQAAMTLYDTNDNELAYDDDYRFDPDPVLFYTVPNDGEYEIEIRDSIFRGRDDFVYRIAIGQLPFVTQVFPLGGQAGSSTIASIDGWNLPTKVLPFNMQPGSPQFRETVMRGDIGLSNRIPYEVDTLPECDEAEPNDAAKEAQAVTLPQVVNGRIGQPGDADMFRFDGHAGDEVVAEVLARRLGSPLDSVVRLLDAAGAVVAWNDDQDDKGFGLITHQADSYLRAKLPQDGSYVVQVSDTQRHGGGEYAYRLTLAPPRPDFALRVTPSSVNLLTGRATTITVCALRKDGFDGDIEIALKDAPAGLVVNGGRIPSGRDSVRMTLTAPMTPIAELLPLQIEGRATIGGQSVTRPAVPAEDMMQAFLYRHLVPSQELLAKVTGPKRKGRPVELASSEVVQLPAGGSARVQVRAPGYPGIEDVRLELSDPPKGVTLESVEPARDGLAFVLKSDGAAVKAGFADNLIVEAFTERAAQGKQATTPGQKQRVPVGVLPAIPFVIVGK
ncbi:MAG: PPC domain-containing protein [Candidatus Hydrogenedentes bacterium]|nr:PPC domain-containing protein [Candidatus Hydrogenedentota bacterium]